MADDQRKLVNYLHRLTSCQALELRKLNRAMLRKNRRIKRLADRLETYEQAIAEAKQTLPSPGRRSTKDGWDAAIEFIERRVKEKGNGNSIS